MFFDTYALIEIAKGNPKYKRYLREKITVTKLNLIELYFAILRDFGEMEAKRHYATYSPFIEEISDEIIFESMRFRLDRRDLSYADCVGYVVARRKGEKFLTGDTAFKGLDGVEFVR